jgi:hypothetical protein
METYGGVQVLPHVFLTLTLDELKMKILLQQT